MFFAFVFLCLVVFLFFNGEGKGTPVLLYHQVNPLINVTPTIFEEHLEYIASKYKTFTYTEAYEYVALYGKLPERSLLITFDDGYYDNYKEVFSLLKKYNIKATFFINTLFISKEERLETAPYEVSEEANKKALLHFYTSNNGVSSQYVTAQEIQEMHASGLCDFQAHTHTHAPVFVSNKLTDFRSAKHNDSSPIHLYKGEVLNGYPDFRSRGNCTFPGYALDIEKAKKFAKEWESKWKHLPKKEALAQGQTYADENKLLAPFSDAEAKERVRREINTNKEIIESITQTPVRFFAWTWGHHSDWGRAILAQEGIVGFVTCKKGGIGLKPNWNNLKRVELRDPSLKKLKQVLWINTNSFTSWIYAFLS